jgi:hypothetical protein
MTCGIEYKILGESDQRRMNELGQHVFHAFAAGSVEELAAALEVITLISLHPKTRRADQDFPRQVGSASQHSWRWVLSGDSDR